MVKSSLLLVILLLSATIASTQDLRIRLYPDSIPGAKKTPAGYREVIDSNGYYYRVSEPELLAFFPDRSRATGTSVIICPGGGYQLVVASYEGIDVAKAFNEIGVTAFVLKYRLPNDSIMFNKAVGPLQDAEMAMRIVRERAKEWKLNPQKVGIAGLSAGGHLASTLGTHFQETLIPNPGQVSLRPDFMVLIYPVISMSPVGPPRTRNNLIGSNPSQEQLSYFSNEKNVSSNTPPSFLLHASDDKRVSIENSLLFYNALLKAGVKAELHLIPEGGHGFGVDHDTRKDEWIRWCASWLKESGF